MLSLMTRLAAALRQVGNGRLFEGFEPLALGLLVTDGASTYSLGSITPDGFSATEEESSIWAAATRHPAIVANSVAEIDGATYATVTFGATEPPSLEDLAAVAAHEAFHAHQKRAFPTWGANEASLFTYPYADLENETSKRLELLALHRAIADPARSHRWLRTHLELRRERYEALAAAAATYEREVERYEGLALYVENKVRGASPAALPEFGADQVRLRGYAVGERIAHLLDRVRPGWQAELANMPDQYLDELASARTGSESAAFSTGELLAARRQAAIAVDRLHTARTNELQSFRAAAGSRLTLRPRRPLLLAGFDPMNVLLLEDGHVLHKRYLSLGNEEIDLELLDVPSLTEPVGPHPLFNGVRSIEIAGLPPEPAYGEVDGWTTLTASGLTLRFAHGAAELTMVHT